MPTLSIKSSGAEVLELQKALGLPQSECDGVFGKHTEAAVRQFQSTHTYMGAPLAVDGVAGTITQKVLGLIPYHPNAIANGVIYKPLNISLSKSKNRKIEYLVIHFTAGSNSKPGKALSSYITFSQGKASADFVVDDRDIVQFNPDIRNTYCWAVGGNKYNNKGGKFYKKCTNANSVHIEICSTCSPSTGKAVSVPNHTGWSFTAPTLSNAIRLARIIMRTFNIPKSHVIRHYDVTGKPCPGICGWNDEPLRTISGDTTSRQNTSHEWQKFLANL